MTGSPRTSAGEPVTYALALTPDDDPAAVIAVRAAAARAGISLTMTPPGYTSPWRQAVLAAGVDRGAPGLRGLAAEQLRRDPRVVDR